MWLCSSVYSEKTMTDLSVTAVAWSPNLISAKACRSRSKKHHAGRVLPVSACAPLLWAGLGFSISAWGMMSRSNRCDSHILLVGARRRCCISMFKKTHREWKTEQHALALRPGRPCVSDAESIDARTTNDLRQLCWRKWPAFFVFRNHTPDRKPEGSTDPLNVTHLC